MIGRRAGTPVHGTVAGSDHLVAVPAGPGWFRYALHRQQPGPAPGRSAGDCNSSATSLTSARRPKNTRLMSVSKARNPEKGSAQPHPPAARPRGPQCLPGRGPHRCQLSPGRPRRRPTHSRSNNRAPTAPPTSARPADPGRRTTCDHRRRASRTPHQPGPHLDRRGRRRPGHPPIPVGRTHVTAGAQTQNRSPPGPWPTWKRAGNRTKPKVDYRNPAVDTHPPRITYPRYLVNPGQGTVSGRSPGSRGPLGEGNRPEEVWLSRPWW